MKVSIIAALASNGVIGKDNDLAWHLPDDMAFFKRTTKGRTVVMGRKNYESIPHKFRPLPGRPNIVITRNKAYSAPGCTVVHSLRDALNHARIQGETHTFVIGGGQIYHAALNEGFVDDMYITEVYADVEGDAYFPDFDRQMWQVDQLMIHAADERHAFPFVVKRYFK